MCAWCTGSHRKPSGGGAALWRTGGGARLTTARSPTLAVVQAPSRTCESESPHGSTAPVCMAPQRRCGARCSAESCAAASCHPKARRASCDMRCSTVLQHERLRHRSTTCTVVFPPADLRRSVSDCSVPLIAFGAGIGGVQLVVCRCCMIDAIPYKYTPSPTQYN